MIITTLVALSCERDDICAETTATTPRLIITFFDINDRDEPKNVRQLEIKGIGDDGVPIEDNIILARTNTDSIALPLRFQAEGEITTSRFELVRSADYIGNDNESLNENRDVIEITYTPEFIYVSRACGYKSIFDLGTTGGITREADDDNWIIDFDILNETIDNESAAHISIYH